MNKKVGICFSKELAGDDPLSHIGVKKPVYMRLLEFIEKEGWDAYVLTRLTYKGKDVFEGGWKFNGTGFTLVTDAINADLVYDRTGGIVFPEAGDQLRVVNERAFKVLCWDKWMAYKAIGNFMPQTILVENEADLPKAVEKINTDMVVLKPFNGLKGLGVFIGPKADAVHFQFPPKYQKYIAQSFVDTSNGILGITPGLHDLRVAVVNGEVVWCHVRVPVAGTFTANAAQGGNLTEVDYSKVPVSIKGVVDTITKDFVTKYDNPIFSLDFGLDSDGTPKIFEINDQMGFPKWEMKNRDLFLRGLIKNFKSKMNA
jgi:glutathione synthase/RimK-type ligase-like ATP-grasp enzyme